MAAANASTTVFDDLEQDKVVADLTTFFGPRAERYLRLYEEIRSRPFKKRHSVPSWNWGVFVASFVWFFYRKQYILGASILLVPFIVSLFIGSVGAGVYIVFAIYANTWYVQSAIGRIAKADKLGLVGEERSDYLRRAGGVSKIGGGIAAFIYFLLLSLTILAAVGPLAPGG